MTKAENPRNKAINNAHPPDCPGAMIMAEQDFVLLDHPRQDTGKAVKPEAATTVQSRLDWPNRILYQKNLQERRHKISVRKLDRVPGAGAIQKIS